MATYRDNPYGAFNFIVSLGNGTESETVGGFSDVSGLGREVNYSEYRNGNESFNTVRKIANTYKNDDVTLKRGLVGSLTLFEWLKNVRIRTTRRRIGQRPQKPRSGCRSIGCRPSRRTPSARLRRASYTMAPR